MWLGRGTARLMSRLYLIRNVTRACLINSFSPGRSHSSPQDKSLRGFETRNMHWNKAELTYLFISSAYKNAYINTHPLCCSPTQKPLSLMPLNGTEKALCGFWLSWRHAPVLNAEGLYRGMLRQYDEHSATLHDRSAERVTSLYSNSLPALWKPGNRQTSETTAWAIFKACVSLNQTNRQTYIQSYSVTVTL